LHTAAGPTRATTRSATPTGRTAATTAATGLIPAPERQLQIVLGIHVIRVTQ
jgi:hypothetical protein